MDTLDYNFFFKILNEDGKWLDETSFYFTDDLREADHMIGYLPQFEAPYWVGDCDIPDGCEYQTAQELLNAPIFDGRSLRERWSKVRIINAMGISLDDWYEIYLERSGDSRSP